MSIKIPLLLNSGLSKMEIIYILSIYNNDVSSLKRRDILESLVEKGYILIESGKIYLRKKTIDIFGEFKSLKENKIEEEFNDLDIFIDEYRNLWPRGIKSGGRLVKGDKNGCKSKMEKFIKANPSITKSEILNAARAYLDSKQRDRYQKTICADYFIEKGGTSQLSSWIELTKELNKNGDDKFHKEI